MTGGIVAISIVDLVVGTSSYHFLDHKLPSILFSRQYTSNLLIFSISKRRLFLSVSFQRPHPVISSLSSADTWDFSREFPLLWAFRLKIPVLSLDVLFSRRRCSGCIFHFFLFVT